MDNNLSGLLGQRLISISKLHDATGISRSTLVSLYYKRASNVNTGTLKKICDYLQIPLSELIEYTPKQSTK
ncbi:helix-turn-helix transcriptional regulator [Lactiplantibacillus plantarum]|uniref:helix-turn-helix domain-containing protein n=1 Tax=Lactiplantibacillus plantarum TaxID=1590 RepID=UPI001BAE1286|nr:helix-turn-helix transcriptional regulator [Lactiplantibacillus plantarum]MBS0952669.1 helix-turn-helix transcriptional regulator [Lactiplantibacillus plantarum]